MAQQNGGAAAAGECEFINLEEVEELARARLPKQAYDYYSGGAETMSAVRDNRAAFGRRAARWLLHVVKQLFFI